MIESFSIQVQPDAVRSIVDRLSLDPFFEFLSSLNCSNFLPYHNFYHASCMLLNCYEGACHEQLVGDELRGLCVGALFHDFNHSGGKLTDTRNVAIALEGLKFAQGFAGSKLLGLSPISLTVANSVIAI